MRFNIIKGVCAAVLLSTGALFGGDQKICPIMVDTEIDTEEVVEYDGVKIYMCCGACTKAWNTYPEYYLKAGVELGLLPQFETLPEAVEKVTLLKQRFCPLRPENVISPKSPSIEYKGKKIYFFKERDIKRKWVSDPEAAFKTAREAGLLPQFDQE